MLAKIQQWGNSQGIRLSKKILEEVQMAVGDEVDIKQKDGTIIISRSRNLKRYDLKELVARIPEGYQANEVDWGKPVGREVL